MTKIYERVNVTKILRELSVGERAIFGRSFNPTNIRQIMYKICRIEGFDLKFAEVPEGHMIWRKS